MAYDPDLDAILADLAALPAADVVTFVSGSESCAALFDDGEMLGPDGLGMQVQTLETAVRYREGAITLPTVDAAVTVKFSADKGQADAAYLVRDARKDPGNPGMIRVALVTA